MSTALPIVSFREPVETTESALPPERVVAGSPRQKISNHFSDATSQFFAGVWSSTRGKWRVSYTENEFCHILAGRVAISDEGGGRVEFSAGDSFVIPAGFAGTWETIEDCRKLYAIFEPQKG
jgi:uncharacterized protein